MDGRGRITLKAALQGRKVSGLSKVGQSDEEGLLSLSRLVSMNVRALMAAWWSWRESKQSSDLFWPCRPAALRTSPYGFSMTTDDQNQLHLSERMRVSRIEDKG